MDPKDMVWTRKQEGLPEGRITNIRKIFDVSVVVRPAYPETSVWSRSKIASDSFDIYSNEEIEIPDSGIEKRNRDLQLLKLKIK
jgi:phage head maturation protease